MRRKNIAGTLVCSILLIGLTLYLAPSILPSPLPVKASSKTISLVTTTNGAHYYWNSSNPTITVTQGDTLAIDVSSSNSVAHRLLIDLDNSPKLLITLPEFPSIPRTILFPLCLYLNN